MPRVSVADRLRVLLEPRADETARTVTITKDRRDSPRVTLEVAVDGVFLAGAWGPSVDRALAKLEGRS